MNEVSEILGNLWSVTRQSYGVLPIIVAINLYQLWILAWLCMEHVRDLWRRRRVSKVVLTVLRRSALATWERASTYVKSLSLLGPALGLLVSTLFSSLGVMEMGTGLTSGGQAELTQSVGLFLKDIGISYVLLVLSTIPLITGVAAVALATPIQRRSAPGPTRGERALDALLGLRGDSTEARILLSSLVDEQARTAEALEAILTHLTEGPPRRRTRHTDPLWNPEAEP